MENENLRWYKIALSREEIEATLGKDQVKLIRVNGKKFCLSNLSDGFYALGNRCPHAGGSLGDGRVDEEGNVICPVHRLKYDLKTGKNTSGEGFYVESYPVEIRNDGVYLGMPQRNWFGF